MKEGRPPEINFIICYAELIILGLFALQEKQHIKSKISLYLFLFPFLSFPSLLFARAFGNFYQSIFLMMLLSLSAFLYQFYLKNMDLFIRKNIFNFIILIWIGSGILTKIYEGVKWGSVLAPYMSSGLYGVLSRGGGIGASNHVGGIILFFLPFIKDYRILLLANLFLFFTFSRGVYFVLLLFWLIKLFPFIKIKKTILKSFLGLGIVFFLTWRFLPEDYKIEISNWVILRIVGSEYAGLSFLERGYTRFSEESRLEIYKQAFIIFKETMGQGIGLGGFYWGQKLIGEEPMFSNAHNLYLTLLCEGGVFFLLGFIWLLFYMFNLAYKYSKDVLLALFLFTIYGFFSGEIYEASGLASACDYYYLIFLLAYLQYVKNNNLKEKIINIK